MWFSLGLPMSVCGSIYLLYYVPYGCVEQFVAEYILAHIQEGLLVAKWTLISGVAMCG
jgi:hypothetical protein